MWYRWIRVRATVCGCFRTARLSQVSSSPRPLTPPAPPIAPRKTDGGTMDFTPPTSGGGPCYPVVTTVAGVGRRGFTDGHRLAAAYLDGPGEAAVLPDGSVLLADGRNNCLRRLDFSTDTVTTLPTHAFLGPRSPCVIDGGAAVVVADSGHNKIRMLQLAPPGAGAGSSNDGGLAVSDCTIAGTGRAGLSDGSADAAMFNHPVGLCVIGDGSILVTDCHNHAIRRIAGRAGKAGLFVTTIIGGGAGAPGFLDGDIRTARLRSPTGIVVDAAGTVLIADTGNNAIRALHPPLGGDLGADGWVLTTLSGGGAADSGFADGDAALVAQFREPVGLAIGADGELLVADAGNNAVRCITSGGSLGPRAGLYALNAAGGVESLHAERVGTGPVGTGPLMPSPEKAVALLRCRTGSDNNGDAESSSRRVVVVSPQLVSQTGGGSMSVAGAASVGAWHGQLQAAPVGRGGPPSASLFSPGGSGGDGGHDRRMVGASLLGALARLGSTPGRPMGGRQRRRRLQRSCTSHNVCRSTRGGAHAPPLQRRAYRRRRDSRDGQRGRILWARSCCRARLCCGRCSSVWLRVIDHAGKGRRHRDGD